MAKRKLVEPSPAIVNSWTSVEEWNGIVRGDRVLVKGLQGEWRFLNVHVRDDVVIAVNVHGGTYRHEKCRTFTPDRVNKPEVKVKRVRKSKVEG